MSISEQIRERYKDWESLPHPSAGEHGKLMLLAAKEIERLNEELQLGWGNPAATRLYCIIQEQKKEIERLKSSGREMESEMKKWEIISTNEKEARRLAAEGWEPFAVHQPRSGTGFDPVFWLKKAITQ